MTAPSTGAVTGASGDPQKDLVEVWQENPERHVFVIDEARFDSTDVGRPGETVVFAVVCTRASALLDSLIELERVRTDFPPQAMRPKFKAKKIFGGGEGGFYAGHRKAIRSALRSAGPICRYATTTPHLLGLKISPTRLTDGTTIEGREFPVLQLMMKEAANKVGAGTEEVDVLVDRSAQLGLDPNQHLLGSGQFQMFVAGKVSLNVCSDGSTSAVCSPAGFRIIAIGEETLSLGDILLLPDTVAYLTRGSTIPSLSDARIPTGVVPFDPISGVDFLKLVGQDR